MADDAVAGAEPTAPRVRAKFSELALLFLRLGFTAFLLVALVRPVVARVRRSPIASAFLDGVNVAALALMAVVTVQLARSALVDVPTTLLVVGSAAALIRFNVNTTWLVAGGAVLGVVVKAMR